MSQQPKVHDTSDFPIVRFDGASIYNGYSSAWCAEMDELVVIELLHGDTFDFDFGFSGTLFSRAGIFFHFFG
mgnify:CR=1 FL=1